MEKEDFKVYAYRWVVLLAFMIIVAVNQLLWITFAPITGIAAKYYGVSDLGIGLLSMSFMIVYVVVSIPASWAIDTYGIRIAVGIGAVLTGLFGLIRGLLGNNYTWVLVSQILIAMGQPFLLNAITKVAARWFPLRERATASGLGTLAMYLGISAGLALTPFLSIRLGIGRTLMLYGILSAAAAVIFFALVRERPPTAPCRPDQEERSLVFDGLRGIVRDRNFVTLMLIFFVGLGVFNGITTWIEDILRPRGFSATQAGTAGGLMIAGGLAGALIFPPISDRLRRRTPFIFLAIAGATFGLAGVTFALSYPLLLVSSFVTGLFLLSAGPIGFQYGAEATYPVPEGTSNGLLLLMGQISGILFIFGMDALKSKTTGSMTAPLIALIALMGLSLILCARLKESALLKK
jgi:cyanate permease